MIGIRSIACGTKPCSRSKLRQEPINRGKRGGAFDLWQDDPVEAGADDRDEITVAELGVSGIDSNIEERLARKCQCRDHGAACGTLLGGRDGVLKVKNYRVGIERQSIGHAPGMVARRKQKTA